MLLVIDVSNTNMVLGVFNGENLVANWRLSAKSGRTADETGLLICSLFAYSDVSPRVILRQSLFPLLCRM